MTAATMTEHAPFRADQVGSLLRPPELKAARERRAKGELSAVALAEIEDRLIRAAIKMQEEVGLRAITDGDFRRQSWSSDFLCAIKGVVQAPPPPRLQQEDAPVGGIVRDWQPPTPKVVSKLEWPNGGITRKAFQFDDTNPQGHDSFAKHAAFSRRTRRRRSDRVSRHGGLLCRPHRRLPR
jgi:methionine synthase II (cobalamin-independent)